MSNGASWRRQTTWSTSRRLIQWSQGAGDRRVRPHRLSYKIPFQIKSLRTPEIPWKTVNNDWELYCVLCLRTTGPQRGDTVNGGRGEDTQILTNYWKDWSFCLKELVCEIRLLVWEASHQFGITKERCGTGHVFVGNSRTLLYLKVAYYVKYRCSTATLDVII